MTVRVLIVDDSLAMRAAVSNLLKKDPDIEVVGTAADAYAARELIKSLNPDVVTLDVEMPGIDGLDFLERLMRLRPMPVVMLSTLTAAGATASVNALALGAFECVNKSILSSPESATLATTVKAAAKHGKRSAHAALPKAAAHVLAVKPRADAIIAIGASTGGVEALLHLLSTFPENCPPTLVVQHMLDAFTSSFAARLDRHSKPKVVEARPGAPLQQGTVYLAPGGPTHLELGGVPGKLYCRVASGNRVSGHCPSVDQLFHSVARVAGSAAVGAIMTGMGSDGALGLKAMRDAGAKTLGQDKASCVVYGMSAQAYKLGGVEKEIPLSRMGGEIMKACAA
ncbi:protein-glutamate methylesterase/protein-glutamine glutaminase [Novosphingopyxis baekryungensis]|uniref:protein-glutamate methylesterase/protein-glutamine glutaminase n=1 Tax=Novosphingopyxis baekryungensis TaxID=279369 RepID=UPI0003B3D1C3|nr:chemotaxis response regulator protein-glutamate methylesterase [Novosphingopyxis baekryungensis]